MREVKRRYDPHNVISPRRANRGGTSLLTIEAAKKEFEPACVYVNTASIGLPPHDLDLANALRERLGLPSGDSAIVMVATEGGLERLREADIKASVRAGAVRLSFHLHNTESDVDTVARALGA